MNAHPYATAKSYQRWSTGMARPDPTQVDPVVEMPFRISPGDKVATAGSCFAQHIGARLRDGGMNLLVTESAHPLLPSETAKAFSYGMFSARFGNIYTARQLLQLLRRARGQFEPAEEPWRDEQGRWFDPFRPSIQPGGFATRREYDADQIQHLAAVRRMFETADVLIFTLGLTECWVSHEDGAAFPTCPGVAAGSFDPERHVFRNFDAGEVTADLRAFLAELREINPEVRVILTVSPVPLAATAEARHVWTSTTWSKAVLRVAAEAVIDGDRVAYFPSYEVITSPGARGGYFNADLRSVTTAGVDHVMRLFFQHAVASNAPVGKPEPSSEPAPSVSAKAVEVMCEEAMLDFVAKQPRSSEDSPVSQARTVDNPGQRKRPWDAVKRWFDRPLATEAPPAIPGVESVVARNATAAVGGAPGRAAWPPTLPDPQPDWSNGLPEIARERLSGDVIGGSILHHGSLLVRGLFDEHAVKRLAHGVERAFDDASAILLDGQEQKAGSYFAPYPLDPDCEMTEGGRLFVMQGGGVWTADSPPTLNVVIEELRRAGVVDAIQDYLGEAAYLSVGKSTLRRVPPTSHSGWHQDGAFLGPKIRTVNCWIALSDCGEDAPGLDIYPRRLNEVLAETGTRDAVFDWSAGDIVVDELATANGVEIVSPRFKAGDVMFFDQLCLHRTGVRPGMTKDRLAIETWLFAGSTFPMKQIPLAL